MSELRYPFMIILIVCVQFVLCSHAFASLKMLKQKDNSWFSISVSCDKENGDFQVAITNTSKESIVIVSANNPYRYSSHKVPSSRDGNNFEISIISRMPTDLALGADKPLVLEPGKTSFHTVKLWEISIWDDIDAKIKKDNNLTYRLYSMVKSQIGNTKYVTPYSFYVDNGIIMKVEKIRANHPIEVEKAKRRHVSFKDESRNLALMDLYANNLRKHINEAKEAGDAKWANSFQIELEQLTNRRADAEFYCKWDQLSLEVQENTTLRPWIIMTSATYTRVVAEYVSRQNGMVTLKTNRNETLVQRFNDLSQHDQDYVVRRSSTK